MKGRRYPEIAKTGAVLGAFLAVLGFQLLYSIYEGDNTMLSDSVFSLLSFGAFLFLGLQTVKESPDRRTCLYGLAGGGVFAALTSMGFSLNYTDTIWHRNTFLAFLCLTPFFTACVILALLKIRRKNKEDNIGTDALSGKEKRRWFLLCWLFLFLSWVPVLLASWPGIFSYDSGMQLVSFMDGEITGHHPILHTCLLGGCMKIGKLLFGSNYGGAALYSLVQMLVMSGLYAYVCLYLKERCAPRWLQIGTFVFFAVHPVNSLMALCATKDSIFGALFAAFLVRLLKMEEDREGFFGSVRQQIYFCLHAFLVFAFRNNGFHTFLLCTPFFLLLFRKYWKRMGILCLICLMLWPLYTGPVYRMLGIPKSDPREMYSVVMQSAARVYNLDYLGLTEEEKEGFLSIISEYGMESYLSRFADPVKSQFKGEKFAENPGPFLKAWVSAGMRHKKIYIDSFLANTFGYWYPGNSLVKTNDGTDYFEYCCKYIREDVDVEMRPVLPALSEFYQRIGNEASFQHVPVVSATFNLGTYTWLLLFALMFLLYRRQYGGLTALLPLLMYFFTSLLGPIVKMRYHYPLIAGVPLILYLIWKYAKIEREGRSWTK